VNATFDIAAAFAQRGSVKDCDYFLKQGGILAKVLRSSAASARVVTQIAQLRSRMRCHEDVAEKLGEASTALVLVSLRPQLEPD